MGIQFGDVVAVGDHGARIRLDSGQELHVSASSLTQLGARELGIGARVRLVIEDGDVQGLVVLSGMNKPTPESAVRIEVQITGIDPQKGILSLATETGKAQFGPVNLSEEQWSRLTVGSEVTILRSPEGKHSLQLPKVDPGYEGPDDSQDGPDGSSRLPVNTIGGKGRLAQVARYHAVVEGNDGERYGCMRSNFPGFSFHEGDEVAFRAIQENNEIVDLSLLKRWVPGFGGPNPCEHLLMDLVDHTERRAIAELAKRFCLEERLEWYWITPKQKAQKTPVPDTLGPKVIEAIGASVDTFDGLFKHQAMALEALEARKHVLVLTPTASGKTLCYNPAVFQALQGDPAARALYVFPLNALLKDQVGKLRAMARAFEEQGVKISIERLIGGLERQYRDEVQRNPPQILATNPEMLSYVLNGNAWGGWPDFLRSLRFVVLDEVHTYRSLLGLHMAGLVRRLLIACRRYGNPTPQFVLSSATVGAPEELATRLTSIPLENFVIIGQDQDGSEQQQRHWMVLSPYVDMATNPHNMHLYQAALTLVDVLTELHEDLNAILFAKSIRDVRFTYRVVQRLLSERGYDHLKRYVEQYVSALLTNEEKGRIYSGLQKGDLRAVVSTNALEAGIDIGKLDVCIIAGFPFHVMRMRQMAGRAGRSAEGAVIYIPHPMHAVDKYYQDDPKRLLTQPPEAFVIDHENPYIARKHVIACAASLPGGVGHQELQIFGGELDGIIQEAREHNVLEAVDSSIYTARRHWGKDDPWAIGNMRSAEQNPYAICQAPPQKRESCSARGCTEHSDERDRGDDRCPHLVQLLDRQYVYREAHPGAVFEDRDGDLYDVEDFDDRQKVAWVKPLPEDAIRRTFADESTTVTIIHERGGRDLPSGTRLAWGDATVTRAYTGFYEYDLIPRRRCTQCQREYEAKVTACSSCKRPTRPFLASSRPKYRDFPGDYQETTYSLTLKTMACWIAVPASIEAQLEAVARCPIRGRENRVSQCLEWPARFTDASELKPRLDLSTAEAECVANYFRQHGQIFSSARHRYSGKFVPIYPAFYGQCLRYHLRQHLPEDRALAVFGEVVGYPVLSDERHICRNCVASVLLPAVHTLDHLVALRYPTVALGDSQDLGLTTCVLHPQTQKTTAFWYDNYDGGIGAAEKIFDNFDRLLHEALESLECNCRSDEGCPVCTQTLRCSRRNEALSKIAVRGLIHHILDLPAYIPTDPLYWTESQARQWERDAEAREQAASPVRSPSEPAPPPANPFWVLRVQPHVHDEVLRRVLEIRGEEIADDTPLISIQQLQRAHEAVRGSPRPEDWDFPAEWSEYEVLHVDADASKRLTHTAYKTIVFNVHPDRNKGQINWANEATKQVNAAWHAVQKNWRQASSGQQEGDI